MFLNDAPAAFFFWNILSYHDIISVYAAENPAAGGYWPDKRGGDMHNHITFMERHAQVSLLRHVSGPLKTGFAATVLLLCLVLGSIPVSVWVLVSMMAAVTGMGGVKLQDYVRLLGIPLFFIAWSGIALLWTSGDGLQALQVSLRAMGAVSALYFLVLTTPVSDILAVMRRCHAPGLLTALLYLTYRYIFVLTDVWQDMHTAAASRLGYTDYRTSLRTFGGIGSNLLALSLKRADDSYRAMESRCYDGDIRFLETGQTCRFRDRAFAVGYVIATLALWRLCG